LNDEVISFLLIEQVLIQLFEIPKFVKNH